MGVAKTTTHVPKSRPNPASDFSVDDDSSLRPSGGGKAKGKGRSEKGKGKPDKGKGKGDKGDKGMLDQHYLRARCESQHGPCGQDDTRLGNFGVWLKGVMKIVSVPGGLGIRGRSFGLSPVSRRVVCIGIPQKQV